MLVIDWDAVFGPTTEATFAQGRLSTRTYLHKSFTLNMPSSRDHGHPARWVVRVFDQSEQEQEPYAEVEWEEHVVSTSPHGRVQLKLMVAREAGEIRELLLQRVPTDPGAARLPVILSLNRAGAMRLVELVRALEFVPVEGDSSVRVDDWLLRDLFQNPAHVAELYSRMENLVRSDADARDVIALARRREVVETMRTWLTDDVEFAAAAAAAGGPEGAWQRLFNNNPWVLGLGLAGQLFTAWDEERLEQTVVGFSVAGPGKRVDALLRSAGAIRAMAFAEIKHHRTSLLTDRPYRPGCWAPSTELAGGVTQVQQTTHRAAQRLGVYLPDVDGEGADIAEGTHLIRPRSFLVIGSLDQLRGDQGVHRDRYHSFELYRRNLVEPEVLTFDELLSRAEYQLSLADREAEQG